MPGSSSGAGVLHPRHESTTKAWLDIQTAIITATSKYALTFGELVNIIAVILTSWSKSEVRTERTAEVLTVRGEGAVSSI